MTGQASRLDMEKLRKVRALMDGGKTAGERQAAKAKAEARATRAGMSLQAALSRLDIPGGQPANPFAGFADWMEGQEPGWMANEAARRADREAKRLARCKELLAEYGSEDAVFAPTDLEAALRDALAALADEGDSLWRYRGFSFGQGPTDAMWQAMRGAVCVPETVQEAWAAFQAHDTRTNARCAFDPGYTSHEWEEAWRSALEYLLTHLRTPTAEGITARLAWLEHRASQEAAPDPEQEQHLIASLQADFATFAAPVQSGRPSAAGRRAEVLTILRSVPGLSGREIARRVGCSPQTVGNIRRGWDRARH